MFLVWNVRGAGGKLFPRTVSNLKQVYGFEVLCIVEPRISGKRAQNIIKSLNFEKSYIVEAQGFSGGMWLLWNDSVVSMEVLSHTSQTITVLMNNKGGDWLLTFIYASPTPNTRKNLWKYLDDLGSLSNLPWVLMGDFNEICSSAEKKGGRNSFTNTGMAEWIDINGMVDLGFTCQKFG